MSQGPYKDGNAKIPEDLLQKLESSMDRAAVDKKKRKRRNSSLVIAALLVVGLILPNTTPAVSQAMAGIPVIGDLFRVVTVRDFHEETSWSDIDVEIPHIAASDAAGQEEADKVNAQIDATCEELLARYDGVRSDMESMGYQSLQIQGDIVSDREDLFTLRLSVYEASADGMLQEDYYTIDKRTGKEIFLTDLYGTAGIEKINKEIRKQMETQMAEDPSADYFIGDDGFTGVTDEQDFYIDADGTLVVCFDEAEVAPASMGTVSFRIPIQ